VFSTGLGSPLDAANVRRAFRRVAEVAGLDAETWTPRELRHSSLSLLSSTGLAIEDISHLVGHANTRVTESVYREELRPVLTRGAGAMDALFPRPVGAQIGKQGSYRWSPRELHRLAVAPGQGGYLVGDTGFEPVTSSVSGKRATAAPIARGGDGI